MATEQHHQQRVLKQDGYLDLGDCNSAPSRPFEMRNVVYHPQLNVLLLFDNGSTVKVLDANSGVILQTYHLSSNGKISEEKNHTYAHTNGTHSLTLAHANVNTVENCELEPTQQKIAIYQ